VEGGDREIGEGETAVGALVKIGRLYAQGTYSDLGGGQVVAGKYLVETNWIWKGFQNLKRERFSIYIIIYIYKQLLYL